MKKIFIILSLVIPFHTSQALGVGDILDWVKPLLPWQENEPSLTFELTDTAENIYTQENTRGKYLVVNFWATWCTPCLKEIPVFVEFYNQHADQVEILGLDYEPINLSAIDKFIERFSINYPIILFDEKNESEYPKFGDIVGMPTTQIYDPKGELMQTFLGEINIEDLQKIIPI
jgi:thiol-disulfide isomerase/thioredoxin